MDETHVKAQVGDRIEYSIEGPMDEAIKGKRTGIIYDVKRTGSWLVRPDQPPTNKVVVFPEEVIRVVERPNPDGTVTKFGEGN